MEQLADKIGGVHFTTVGKIETGKIEMTLSRMQDFARALDVSVAELYEAPEEREKGETLPVKYLRRGDTIESGLLVERSVLRGFAEYALGDVILQAVSFQNLLSLTGMLRNSHVLVRSDDFGLIEGCYYAVKNQKGEIFLSEYKEGPARFVRPTVGSRFKDMILGQDQIVILGICLVWEVALVPARHPSVPSRSGEN